MVKNLGEKKPRRSGVLVGVGLVKLLFLNDIIGHPKFGESNVVVVHLDNRGTCTKSDSIETIEPELSNRMSHQNFHYFDLHFSLH